VSLLLHQKCFVLAVAAVSAKLRAMLLNETCKTLQFVYRFVNSALDGQFCASWQILHKILSALQNSGIPRYLVHHGLRVKVIK